MWWGERLLRATIVDDLGERSRVVFTKESPLFDAKVRREQNRLLIRDRPLFIGWLSVFALLVAGTAIEHAGIKVPWFVLPPLLGYVIWLGLRFQRVAKQALRSSRMNRNLCPACTYGLAGVPARHDGLTICPECSAAWRIDESNSSPHAD